MQLNTLKLKIVWVVFEHFVEFAPKGLKQKKTMIFLRWNLTINLECFVERDILYESTQKRRNPVYTVFLCSSGRREIFKWDKNPKETFLENVGPNRSSLSGEFINYYEDVSICFCIFNVFIDNYELWLREKGRYCIYMNNFSSARGSANDLWWWEESRKGEGGGVTGKDLSYINTCQICYEWSRVCRFGWGRYMACWV